MKNFPDCYLIDCEQRSQEWVDHRKGLLTASQFGDWLTNYEPSFQLTIEQIKLNLENLGIKYPAKGKKDDFISLLPNPEIYFSPTKEYKNSRLSAACKVLAELAGFPDPPPKETDDMRRGTEMEPLARDEFQKLTGLEVDQIGMAKSRHGWFGCSPDGLILSQGSGLEIKCPRPSKLIEYIANGELPEQYKPQVHGSMAVTGARMWHFFAWHPGFPPFHKIVVWDDYTDKMLEGLKQYSAYFVELSAKMESMQNQQPIKK